MAKYNIAQVGTFDCENIGDLMFPSVLAPQLKKRMEIENLFLFSLNNCTRPLDSEELEVFSIDRLDEIHHRFGIDAVIFGGGDLVRFDNSLAVKGNYESKNTSFDLLFYSIFFASKHNIPLIFNCPGVPFEFSETEKAMLKEYLEHVDYLAIRDNKSKEMLKSTGTEREISVFPDTVLSLSSVFDPSRSLSAIKKKYPILQGEYFVFQSFPALNEKQVPLLREQLKEIAEYYDLPVIMFPIGRVHNDHLFLKEFTASLNDDRFVFFDEKLDLKKSCALLSGAKAFIGTSLHGNIISNSYSVPSIALDAGDLVKVRNSFKILDREEFCIKNIAILKETLDKVLKEPKLGKLKQAISLVEKHFDNVKEVIEKGKINKPSFMEGLRKTYSYYPQKKYTSTIYFDNGYGFSQENIFEKNFYQQGFVEITVPINCETVRIDPIEGVFAAIRDVNITADGEVLNFTHNGVEHNGKILYHTLDPQLIVSVKDKKELKISFNINIISDTTPELYGDMQDFLLQFNTYKNTNEHLKAQLKETQKSLEDTLIHVKNLEAVISELEKRNSLTENKLNEQIGITEQMKNSTSWKITAPIRKINDKLKK